ncbi:MAG: acyl-[acyl-carrier-protein] thioesterase [Candidatus Onthomonas sp.]
MFFKELYSPRVSDYNRNGKLSCEAILQILETAGSHHSDQADDNVITGSQHGIAWILVDWRVSILRRTDSTAALNITTWVRGKSGSATVYRDFILTDTAGNEVIRAEAKFCLLDRNTGKLTRINDALFRAYAPEDRAVFHKDSPRLRAPAEFMTERSFSVRRSDIDFNGHVHNTRYMDFALEALPDGIYAEDTVSEVRIVYSKPLEETDHITVKYAPVENGHFIGVYAGGTLCTMIALK